SEPALRHLRRSKLPPIDRARQSASRLPPLYARDARTKDKVLPKLLAKLVGGFQEAPGKARPEASERPEHQSPPKWHRSLDRRATTTRIVSGELSGAKALVALSTVTLQKTTSQPSQEKPPSSAPARVVSLERLAALAVPKRRKSKSDEEAAQSSTEGAVRKPGDRPVRKAKEASGKEARAELPPASAKPTPTPARNRAPARHSDGENIGPTTDKGRGPYPSQRAGSERSSQKSPTPKPKAAQPQKQKEKMSSTSVASSLQPNSSIPEDGPQSHSPLQPLGLGGVQTSTSNTSFVAANQPVATETPPPGPKVEETGADVSAEGEDELELSYTDEFDAEEEVGSSETPEVEANEASNVMPKGTQEPGHGFHKPGTPDDDNYSQAANSTVSLAPDADGAVDETSVGSRGEGTAGTAESNLQQDEEEAYNYDSDFEETLPKPQPTATEPDQPAAAEAEANQSSSAAAYRESPHEGIGPVVHNDLPKDEDDDEVEFDEDFEDEAVCIQLASAPGKQVYGAVELTPAEITSLDIISSSAKRLDWYAARFKYGAEVYADMCDAGTQRTAITYTTAVRLFTQLKNHAKALSLWEDAKNSTLSTWTPKQKYLFLNEMVNDAATAANLTRVTMFLDEILQEGMDIDAGTWGAALNGCKLAAKPKVAEYFLELMAQGNISINEVHFRCVIAAYAGRPWQKVNEMASRAAQVGIDTLDRFFVDVHVASLLGDLSRTSRVKSQAQAQQLVDEAKPEHRCAALDVISRAKAQGTNLLRLSSRVYRALQ
ncbi:HACE1, partial [Symbiodinium sp. CCMP2456]